MANTVTKALLEKYLDNRCTPEEVVLVEIYLQQPGSDAALNAVLASRLEADMELSMQAPEDEVQKAAWSARMRSRMGRGAKIRPMGIWRYAAIGAAVLAGVGGFTLLRMHKPATQSVALLYKNNPQGQRAIIHLADGSVIHLGAGSRLDYPEAFTGEKREISLTGEAYFEVAEDPAHPFVVRTGSVATTVLGTSFKISAFGGKPLSVAVATGKVRVDYEERELAVLTPGKQMTWNSGNAQLADVAVADIEGWQKGRLMFNSQSLQEVAADLERWYNVKISFVSSEKATAKITVTLFGSAPLDKTLQTLAAGSGFSYKINGRDVLIQ
ncbi:FecR domain-containing protein [Chitinophaga horti]|uniref:FecR domain-containing protein n=1 Tax=Chitinophaga horti TaxID=2920382 RepID=A0ABY6JAQ4_9BACT|nr:FecR domain-containing protein [Chitinophaga horti]UYQ95647.1 FecR domain-containing protein [Chitinophaga horti]